MKKTFGSLTVASLTSGVLLEEDADLVSLLRHVTGKTLFQPDLLNDELTHPAREALLEQFPNMPTSKQVDDLGIAPICIRVLTTFKDTVEVEQANITLAPKDETLQISKH